MFSYYLPVVAGIFLTILALVVVSNKKIDRYHAYFALFLIMAAAWSIGIGLFLLTSNIGFAHWLVVEFYVLALFIAYTVLLFARTSDSSIRKEISSKIRTDILLVLPITALSLWIILTGGIFDTVRVAAEGNSYRLNLLPYLLYSVIFMTYVISALVLLIKKYGYQEAKRNNKRQFGLKLIAGSIIFGMSFGTIFNLALPVFGIYSFIWLGPVGIVPSALIFWYAILRHGIFDVRSIVVRTLGYVLSIFTLAAVYLLLAYFVSFIVLNGSIATGINSSPVNVLFALVLALIFQPVKRFFDQLTNNIFYRDRYDPEEFFALLSNVLSTTTDLKTLTERAAEVIGMTFRSQSVSFFVRESNGHTSIGTSFKAQLHRAEADLLDRIIVHQKLHLIVQPAGSREITRIMERHGLQLLLPLWHENTIVGYVGLGESLRSRYSLKDQRVFETTMDELVIAIQNVISLQEVSELNAGLQTRIDHATRSLRVTNQKLRKLDGTKDEFLSMASHQLRTPLTSVKGYVSMILDGDAGPINEQQRKFLTEAFASSNRMAGIIGDFLNVSRLQTGKFSIEREPIDLGELVDSEVDHLANVAGVRGLKLHFKRPAHFPIMNLDRSKIEQVVMNFIDNAIFYAPDTGEIEVELFQRSGRAVFTVRDHGIGVPKAEQAELFSKFFRATNARRKRPDGTGVGLFLAKKVVVAHKGTIIFESEEGKGSTFGFEIPLKAE